jgi:glycosyltransferase involved in cell wall biosynthesis
VVRVLLDATAVPGDRGGVGRYVDNLVPALVRQGADVRVVCQPQEASHYGELSGRDALPAPKASTRAATRIPWEQVGLPRLIGSVRPDVVHSPHYTQPFAVRRPRVVTLHDATFFTAPEVHLTVKAPFFRTATRLALRSAAACVVPSQATADELVRVAGARARRLVVAHHGVDTAVFAPPSAGTVDAVRDWLGLRPGQDYLAFLGTLEPRKNVPALIRGWVRACAGRAHPPALVLAGGRGWDDDVTAAVAEVPQPLTLLRPGYVAQQQLAGLLGGARVVAYPSLAEGFGLPVLEAMACGAAVLTSRHPALTEVGADAVAYTETDAASIGVALAALLDDASRRDELAAAGPRRAAPFTWDASAQAHLSAYEVAIRDGSR